MGIYTVLDDKKVEEVITNDLTHIINHITTAMQVRAIILGGGFGRGEGGVLINQNGIRPVNDYDLFIIVSDNDQTDFRSLSKIIAKEIGIRSVDLIPIKYCALSTLPPTQFNYDLKYGSRHLWGENIFDLIPQYKKGYVDPESGKTLLLNRLICAIEAFSEDFEHLGITAKEAFFLANQTGKVVSACVEALLIRKGKYHHSYLKRQEILKVEFPKKKILQQLNEMATEFKLRPAASPVFDTIAYWKEAIHEYVNVISDHLAPALSLPKNNLWRLLKNKKDGYLVTNNPVERVELMLLLHREASFLAKRRILSKARKELEGILKTPFSTTEWEALRKRTALLWHELYH